MRLKAEIWVKAYIRICMGHDVPAVVVRRGHSDAGAIYLKINRLDGTACLWGPAPAGLEPMESDRMWSRCHETDTIAESDADQYLERQFSFDPDIWIIEVEARDGRNFLDETTLI